MKRIIKYSALLSALKASDPQTRVGILRSAPDEFIKALVEVVLNTLVGNISHTSQSLQKIKRYKSHLRGIEAQRYGSVNTLRKKMTYQKGGFLPLLLAPLLAATPFIAKAVGRNAARSATNAALDAVEKRVKGYIDKV